MSITQTNSIAKIAAVVAGLGLVAMSFASFAVPAKAATTDLSSQIAALQAQLAALMAQAGGTSASATFNVDLTIGSTGADVTALQNWLIANGASIPAGATGYFGAQTKAALAAWQAKVGISPAVGYFGPITRAKVNAMGATGGTTTTGGTTSGLSGGSGSLKNIDSLGDVETDLHTGDSATKVLGFEAEAKDSDLAVQRVDVLLSIGGSGSATIGKYVDTVAIYQDGKKLASMDASDGDKDGRDWTFRFSDLNGVIREGDTASFYAEVTPVDSINDTEAADTITASFPTDGIRAVDAEGVSETYSETDDNDFTVTTATTGDATISEASDNPDSSTVKADTSNTTEDVTLLSFNVKAKNQDITIHDLPVAVQTNSGGAINDYVQSIALVSGGKTLKTITATTTNPSQDFVFNNIDQDISKDDVQNFQVVATIRKIDVGGSNTFNSGDSLTASTTGLGTNGAWDVEDTNGDTFTVNGGLTGNAITFQSTGITVTKTDASYTKTVGQNVGEGDKTQYSISFKVTAGDDDLYIQRAIVRATTTPSIPVATAVMFATTTSSGGAGVIAPSYTATNLSAGDSNSADATNYYKIPSGTSRTFTLNVTLTASSTGFTGVQLAGFGYGTSTASGSIVNPTTFSSGLDTFKTADVSMTTH